MASADIRIPASLRPHATNEGRDSRLRVAARIPVTLRSFHLLSFDSLLMTACRRVSGEGIVRAGPIVSIEPSSPSQAARPTSLDELCRRADRAVRQEGGEAMRSEIEGLAKLCEGLASRRSRPGRLEALRRGAHDIRGLGGAVGYPLLGEIAASLCLLLDRMLEDGERTRVTPLREAAIAMHVRKLRQIVQQGRTGSGGEAGARLVAGLRAVTEKASA